MALLEVLMATKKTRTRGITGYLDLGKHRVTAIYTEAIGEDLPAIALSAIKDGTDKLDDDGITHLIAPIKVKELPEFVKVESTCVLYNRIIQTPFGDPKDDLVRVINLYILKFEVNNKPVYLNLPWFYDMEVA